MATKAVFSPCRGKVVVFKPSSCEESTPIFKLDFGASNGTLTAPMTGFALELNGNYQFLHTVNDFIYVYSFGDRIGELTISGLGFADVCSPGNNGIEQGKKLTDVIKFYELNRLKEKRDMTVTIGGGTEATTFWAFLTGARFEMQDPQTLVGQWSLRFHVVPKK